MTSLRLTPQEEMFLSFSLLCLERSPLSRKRNLSLFENQRKPSIVLPSLQKRSSNAKKWSPRAEPGTTKEERGERRFSNRTIFLGLPRRAASVDSSQQKVQTSVFLAISLFERCALSLWETEERALTILSQILCCNGSAVSAPRKRIGRRGTAGGREEENESGNDFQPDCVGVRRTNRSSCI